MVADLCRPGTSARVRSRPYEATFAYLEHLAVPGEPVDTRSGRARLGPENALARRFRGCGRPAHLDAEVLSALGRLQRAGRLTRTPERVDALAALGAKRWPLPPLLAPAWALIDRIATRDALYVALAATLDATLVTTDARLRRGATGIVPVAEPAT